MMAKRIGSHGMIVPPTFNQDNLIRTSCVIELLLLNRPSAIERIHPSISRDEVRITFGRNV